MINWKVRYGKVLALFPALRDPARSVLEIGAGGGGIRNYLTRQVVSVDLDHRLSLRTGHLGVTADARRLPFADDGFDLVLCMDTLEHIPPAQRAAAIRELARVCRHTLIIGLPMGAFAAWGDAQYHRHLQTRNVPVPTWLAEHVALGIPSVASIIGTVHELGLDIRLHGNETLIQHYAGVLADEVPFLAQTNAMVGAKHLDAPPIGCGEGDVYYSYLLDIRKHARGEMSRGKVDAAMSPLAANVSGEVSMYCVGHDANRMISFKGLLPFFVGDKVPPTFGAHAGAACDDGRFSIRERNPIFSEMTAIYSVWKNARHGEFVGFCHYRRLFDFQGVGATQRGRALATPADVERARHSIEDIASCHAFLAAGGVIVAIEDTPRPTVAEHYMGDHLADHYLAAFNLILERYPHLIPHAIGQFGNGKAYFNNMFICSAAFFDELCTWWFEVLFELEARLSRPLDPYQQRTIAFLSERLFDIHIRWRIATGTPLRALPIYFLADSAFSSPN